MRRPRRSASRIDGCAPAGTTPTWSKSCSERDFRCNRPAKAAVKQRLKEIGDDPEFADERQALEICNKHLELETLAAKFVKELQEEQDKRVLKKYGELSETEIKTLVVEDKWFASIQAAIEGEVNRITQRLADRVKELEERYSDTMPALEKLVEQLGTKVKSHLKRMGLVANWQQLITGETRLPGFTGAWKPQQLGCGISLLSGHHVLAQHCNTNGEGVPYLTGPADFPNGEISLSKYTTRPGTMCESGDILVTVKGSGAGTIVVADASYCISRQLMAIRVRDWDPRFIYYSLLQSGAKRLSGKSSFRKPYISGTMCVPHT